MAEDTYPVPPEFPRQIVIPSPTLWTRIEQMLHDDYGAHLTRVHSSEEDLPWYVVSVPDDARVCRSCPPAMCFNPTQCPRHRDPL